MSTAPADSAPAAPPAADSAPPAADSAPPAAAPPSAPADSPRVAWVKKNFLPLALIVAFISGLALPGVATAIDTPRIGEFKIAQSLLVIYIFLLQGMNLKVDEIKDALNAYIPVGLGLVIILFITPQAAHLVARLPFLAADLKTGITLFLPST